MALPSQKERKYQEKRNPLDKSSEMVKIPTLELNGQNWKIYRAKYLKVAATENLLSVVAGWESDDGSKDWDHRNRVARMLLYITLPPLLQSHIQLLEHAREVFRYLAYYFLDADPIVDPRAKKLATCANEDKHYPSAESPTSENAATGAEREDLPTKALNRGTEDVDNGNVRHKDLACTSLEASATGTSTKSANGTFVLLTGEPHKMQNVPQNSLPLTPRLPIDGKPGKCKQEVANGVVTAGRTKGMVRMAKPCKTVADINRMALLGRELAERVCGVDEGDGKEREPQSRLQQTNFYCKESHQGNENANRNIPNTYGLPLEGEWLVYASGKTTNPKGDVDVSNAAVEHVYHPSELIETENTMENKSRGCGGGTGMDECIDELETIVECCQQLCMADGDRDHGVKPMDVLNESDMLATTSIESESPDSGGIPRVHLGGTRLRASDANGAGNRTDASKGQADVSRGLTDALNVSIRAEMDGMSNCEGAGTYLGAEGVKRVINTTVGIGSHADASNGHMDVPSIQTNALTTANTPDVVSTPPRRKKPPDSPMDAEKHAPDGPNGCGSHVDGSTVRMHASCVGNGTKTAVNAIETVSTPRKESKRPNSPEETARWCPDEPNGCRSHTDVLSMHTDTHCGGKEMETAENKAETVRTHQTDEETQDSPNACEIATPKPTIRWKKVSAGGIDVYIPQNAPIKATSRIFVFGQPESGDEAIAPSVEGERAGDGDANGTTSGGDANSTQVEAALLAAEGQHTHYIQRSR